MRGLFFLKVNVEFSLKINRSLLLPPLRVVGGTEKGAEEEVRKKRRWEERPRELREGEGRTGTSVLCRQDESTSCLPE